MATVITREFLRTVGAEIQAELDKISKKHGIKITRGNFSYGSGSFHCRVDGKTEAGERLAATRVGLTPEALGGVFVYNGKQFKVKSIKPRGKYRVVATNIDNGRDYKFMPSTVDAAYKAGKGSTGG